MPGLKTAALAGMFCLLLGNLSAHALGRKPVHRNPAEPAPLPTPRPHGKFTLRVMSYNIKGIATGVDHSRYAEIGRALRERRAEGTHPHVVLVQEAFARRTIELVESAGYPYVRSGPKRKGLRFNGGLVILSDFPLKGVRSIHYHECGGIDCIERKGVLSAQVLLPRVPLAIRIFNTHMNAAYRRWPKGKAERIRQFQLLQMRNYMRSLEAGHEPWIFGGDFNFRLGDSNGAFFTAFSRMADAARACALMFTCGGDASEAAEWAKRIDHVFFRGGSTGRISIEPVFYGLSFNGADGVAYSDHPAVETRFRLSW